MTGLGRVHRKNSIGHAAQEEPRTKLARDEIGVLALPAETGRFAQGFFHERRGIDEDLHLSARFACEPRSDPLELALDDVMIVAPERINGNDALVLPGEPAKRVDILRVDDSQHDYRARLGPQGADRRAACAGCSKPVHVAVAAKRQIFIEATAGRRSCGGRGYPDGREAFRARSSSRSFRQAMP